MITDNSTILECKRFLEDKKSQGKGAQCPCCEQLVKVYKRSINALSARSLLHIMKITVNENEIIPLHIQKTFANGKKLATGLDYIQLKRFGLIEPTEEEGFYKITKQGIAFCLGYATIPKYALVYNNKTIMYSDSNVTVQECLKKKFNYEEIIDSSYKSKIEKWILSSTLQVPKNT